MRSVRHGYINTRDAPTPGAPRLLTSGALGRCATTKFENFQKKATRLGSMQSSSSLFFIIIGGVGAHRRPLIIGEGGEGGGGRSLSELIGV
jgi:hypothetical protein